jgi:hypothetical protein
MTAPAMEEEPVSPEIPVEEMFIAMGHASPASRPAGEPSTTVGWRARMQAWWTRTRSPR